jgi:mannan endo-1,4-beta-mannosidase
MRTTSLLTALTCALSFSATAFAAKSFSASNLYYAAGLTDSQSTVLFDGLKSSDIKVLRVWLDGKSTSCSQRPKSRLISCREGQSGTRKGTPINSFPSLQSGSPSEYDDTVLNRLDKLMVKAKTYGIKLLISIHSYNALQANSDFYGKWYGTGDFYTNANAISQFKDRIAHVLAHVNPANGKTWAQSSEYIFAFEAQNEAMHPLVSIYVPIVHIVIDFQIG